MYLGSVVKNLPAMQGTYLSQEDPWEKEKATHSSILAWKTPQTGVWRARVHGDSKSQIGLSN